MIFFYLSIQGFIFFLIFKIFITAVYILNSNLNTVYLPGQFSTGDGMTSHISLKNSRKTSVYRPTYDRNSAAPYSEFGDLYVSNVVIINF